MPIKMVSFLPARTIPETQEQFRQVALNTAGGSKTQLVPKGTMCMAYYSAAGWGRFRYVFAKKRQVAYKPVHYSSYAYVAGVKGVLASALRAGITTQLISNSSYGWVQVEGPNFFKCATDKGVAAGDMVIKDDNTSDLFLDTATFTGTQMGWVMGRALADDSGSWMAVGKLMIIAE